MEKINGNAKFSTGILTAALGESSALFVCNKRDSVKKIILEKGAKLNFFSILNPGASIRSSFSLSEGSSLKITEIFYGETKAENIIEIQGKNCSLQLSAKGIIADGQSSSYNAEIRLPPSSINANVNLEEHALLLGPNSRASLFPGIDAQHSELRARHSSSIRQMDEGQVFYLMSRGLPRKEAEKEISVGFVSSERSEIEKLFGR